MKQLILLLIIFIPIISKSQNDPKKHIYEPERLSIIKDTSILRGIVINIKSELDGDYHIQLKIDSGSVILCKKNYTKQDSCIVLEIVCAHKSVISLCKCEDYTNQIEIPKIGEKIRVIGQLVIDKRHKWIEIHPVFGYEQY